MVNVANERNSETLYQTLFESAHPLFPLDTKLYLSLLMVEVV
jgi:hypothetical protein